jgi:hypothetical protein
MAIALIQDTDRARTTSNLISLAADFIWLVT